MTRCVTLITLLLLVSAGKTWAIRDEAGVLLVTPSNLAHHVAEHYEAGLLVYSHTPSSIECQAFNEVFQDAARVLLDDLQEEETLPTLARLDNTLNHGIKGPSLRFFRKGREIDCTEALLKSTSSDDVIKAARKLAADRCRHVTTLDEVLFEGSQGVRVVGFFSSKTVKKAFAKAAENFRYPVDFVIAPPNLRDAAFSQVNASASSHNVLLLKPYDERVATFALLKKKKKEALSTFTEWVEKEMLPLVVPFRAEFTSMIFDGPLKMHVVLAIDDDDSDDDTVPESFLESARRFRGHALHVLLRRNEDDDELEEVWDFLNIRRTPALLVSDMTAVASSDDDEGTSGNNNKGTQTAYDGDLADVDAVVAFVRPFAARAVALKAGVEPRMADVMADPKLQDMLKDPSMGPMFQIMGMPKKLADIYRRADL